MKIRLGEIIQDQECTIEFFPAAGTAERGLIIIFPGGGYRMLADHEGAPVAEKFVSLGFHAAVCKYRVAPVHYPVQLEDARNAVRCMREHAQKLHIKPDKIAVLGFSAGGHLAAMVSNMPGEPVSRPDVSILCYAVLSANPELIHSGSFQNLFGCEPEKSVRDQFSWPEVANADTPPAFLWHMANDDTVSSDNSVEYFRALQKLNIPAELHIYPGGMHGLGIGDRPGYEGQFQWMKSWSELCAVFLRNLGW